MGGGPVLWLEMEEEEDDEEEEEDESDRDWNLGSPLNAASPAKQDRKNRGSRDVRIYSRKQVNSTID